MNRRTLCRLLLGGSVVGRSRLSQQGLLSAQLARPPMALPTFRDITAASGVRFHHSASHTSQKYLIESMGGGVAMFDSTGDGNLDLFFVNGAALQDPLAAGKMPDKSDPRYWNRLYRNTGDGTFTDVTEKAGVRGHSYGMGVAAGDYDNDGHQDLYITNYGRNILYHNNGDGTFADVTEKAGVGAGGWSAAASFVDYDRDGKLDLVVSRYLDWDIHQNPWCGDRARNFRAYCHPDIFPPVSHILYHNNGDGTFTDVSEKAGFTQHPGAGLGIAVNDFDLDGWPDIAVANDARPQQLFRNNGNGTFTEAGLSSGLAYDEDGNPYSGMGLGFEDYDNDGRPDIFIDNLANQRYALYKNRAGSFEYVTNSSGVGGITILHSGWGTQLFDYDNDGWKDVLVAQGHVMDNIEQTQPSLRYRESLLLMRNVRGKFVDVSGQSGAPFRVPLAARGAAFGDLNNDGFLDVAINCNDGDALILHNQGNANHWLTVDTVGKTSNRDGIGARIHLVSKSGLHQYATVGTAGSYLSSSDKRVHFGLGSEKSASLVEITWPSGIVQRLENVLSNRVISIREPPA
ncbi:MAG: CRTAC1 family protein [Acidobacteriota bacterium]|nr:CRTAC1 family protein [Acidobacteriota bacterium]